MGLGFNSYSDLVFLAIVVGILITLLSVVGMILLVFWLARQQNKACKVVVSLASGAREISAEEFLEMRNFRAGLGRGFPQPDFTGIYIIYNATKNMHYVGQSKNVLKRVAAHFCGSGNGDVYADLKYGDTFTVRAIPLDGSGYASLDALERDAIQAYGAYEQGYNKNRGNGRRGWL